MYRDTRSLQIREHWLPLLLLIAAVVAVYGQLLGHRFLLNWDDNIYVTNNVALLSFSPGSLRAAFSTYYAGNYAPVQMLSYMLDYALWGLWPGGFLLTNIFLHSLNGALLYLLLLRWHGGRLQATVGTALFLLHPVQVETVAWISQRKNLLAMFFFLAAWWGYCIYRDSEGGRPRLSYVVSVALFLFSLLAKSAAVILPVALILYDFCFPANGRRLRMADKIPYMLAAAAVGMLAIHSQQPDPNVWGAGGGRAEGYHGGSPLATLFTMLPVFVEYLRMLVWPAWLSAEYDPLIRSSVDIRVVLSAVLLSGCAALSWRLFLRSPRYGFWPAYILLAFLPVAQIVPLVTLMNDRYFYFPMIGFAALAGGGAGYLWERLPQSRRGLGMLAVGLPLVVFPVISFQRAAVWRDAVTLWRDAAAKVPNKPSVWERLGEACHYSFPAHREEAKVAYLRALELDPRSDISMYNLGVLFTEMAEYSAGEQVLGRLLKVNPANVMGWAALGDIHLLRKEYAQAEIAYKRAQALQPDAVQVVKLLGNLALVTKRYDQARSYLTRVEDEGEGDAENAVRLACVEAGAGRRKEALDWLENAFQRGLENLGASPCLDELSNLQGEERFNRIIDTYLPAGHQ